MKKLLLLLAIASIMSSCKKDDSDPKPVCTDQTGAIIPCP